MKQSSATTTVDFLERLAGRASGAHSGIAPRLPSLFEPAPDTGVIPGTDDDMQVARAVTRQARDSHEETPATENPSRKGIQERSPGDRGAEPDTARRATLAPDDVVPRGNAAAKNPASSATLLPAHAPTEVPRDPVPPPGTPVRARVATPAVERRMAPRNSELITAAEPAMPTRPGLVATRAPVTRKLDADVRDARKNPPEQPARTPDRPEAGDRQGALVPRNSASPRPRIGAVTAPDVTMRPRRDDPPAALPQAPQAPVVNVTIGRVEVRAVQASPRRPRATPSKTKPLGLDEYLKQRGGGQ